jgi:hypothetical protein
MGFKIVKEAEEQTNSFQLMKKSITRTFDFLYTNRKNIDKRFRDLSDSNDQILTSYYEGLQNLKKYELHSVFKKEGKNNLIDIYYDES